jgi:hypothetical protein
MRTILHSDMNCFYASVEMLYHLEYAGPPLAVSGDPEARHGIVLMANYPEKTKRCCLIGQDTHGRDLASGWFRSHCACVGLDTVTM